jgi:2,4-dienoyl-CoA reductase-like NADH-dependent reductase (Old Yellow Enzyme family)/NADPH-dependent 2,4-dienoyl-CoA reductase/sulfur reductase-like enzyme
MEHKPMMLLEPIQVGSSLLKNRMVRSPMLMGIGSADGEVTDRLIDHYADAAKGGLAMVIVEFMAVDWRYGAPLGQLRIDDARFLRPLYRLVEAIHRNNVACEFQLHCHGAFGKDPISPSGVPCYQLGRVSFVQPRAISIAEIEEIRESFIAAAVRAKDVECDGVVIHGATSYLLQQWVSPHTNKRTDRYGGSFENRIQLPLEIVRGIRKKCGPSFLIGYSLVMDELLPDGISIEESTAFAKALEQEGIDHIDLNFGTYETSSLGKGIGRTLRQPKGTFDKTEVFKKHVTVKIFARCNGEHDPLKWEEALQKGQCDVIQIGRPLLCDPELPNKVKERRFEDIRRCIRCTHCYDVSIKPHQVACSLNAGLGKERDRAIPRVISGAKRVLVIGGGPGGLEAARVAANRGNEVTLMEKGSELGGNARVASLQIGKGEIKTSFIDWLERQCRKAGVKIELERVGSAQLVREWAPDVVIIATGAKPLIPGIPGINRPHVVTAEDVILGKAQIGRKVVVAGGGLVGAETADFIAEKGLAESVIVIEMLPEIALELPTVARSYMVNVLLPKWDIKTFTNMQIQEIKEGGVVALGKEWKRYEFEADTVVNALGYVPDTSLGDALDGEIRHLYRIGDCVRPRNILHAVHDAAYAAQQI